MCIRDRDEDDRMIGGLRRRDRLREQEARRLVEQFVQPVLVAVHVPPYPGRAAGGAVSYIKLPAPQTLLALVCRLLLVKKTLT